MLNLADIRLKALRSERKAGKTDAEQVSETSGTIAGDPVQEMASEPLQRYAAEPASGSENGSAPAPVAPPRPTAAPLDELEDLLNLEEMPEPPLADLLPAEAEPVPERGTFDPVREILAGRLAAARLEAPEEEAVPDEAAEYLCFAIESEIYAVSIMDIREIIRPAPLVELPRTPEFVAGILSLRGLIIPVIDMSQRLGFRKVACTGRERIIVLRRGDGFCGLCVDGVVGVERLAADAFGPPLAVLDGVERDFVAGIGRRDGGTLILLDLDRVLDFQLE